MRRTVTVAAALAVLALGSPSFAAPCKDPKTGEFVKCPEKATPKPTRCKDAKGKFATEGRCFYRFNVRADVAAQGPDA